MPGFDSGLLVSHVNSVNDVNKAARERAASAFMSSCRISAH